MTKGKEVLLEAGPLRPSAYTRTQFQRRLDELGFEVELYPGRAVIQNPAESFTVTLHYSPRIADTRELARTLSKVVIEGDPPMSLDLSSYVEALVCKLFSKPMAENLRAPRRRPQPGQPIDTGFYRDVIALYNRLKYDKQVPNAAAEIGRRMGVEAATVRLWVHRGKKHLSQLGEET
jgi:hypothetical protein